MNAYLYDVQPLAVRMLIGPGINSSREGTIKPEVMHLQFISKSFVIVELMKLSQSAPTFNYLAPWLNDTNFLDVIVLKILKRLK